MFCIHVPLSEIDLADEVEAVVAVTAEAGEGARR